MNPDILLAKAISNTQKQRNILLNYDVTMEALRLQAQEIFKDLEEKRCIATQLNLKHRYTIIKEKWLEAGR